MKIENNMSVSKRNVYVRIIDVKEKSDKQISKKSYEEVKRLATDIFGSYDWRIEKDDKGKPFFLKSNYNLSISHTDNLIVVAVSKNRKIGIDVEKIHLFNQKIIDKYYSEKERAEIHKHIGYEAFIETKIWTIKEAYSKCIGTGLTKEVLFSDTTCYEDYLYLSTCYSYYMISLCISKE